MDALLQSVLRTMMPECLHGHDGHATPEVFARNIDEALNSTIDTVSAEVRGNEAVPRPRKPGSWSTSCTSSASSSSRTVPR